jgi:uncharacterized protein (TIGR02594 family)
MEPREKMWLELMKYYGLKEIPGPVDNPTIVAWFKDLGFPQIQDDETAWCSLTMNKMAKDCEIEYTGKLDARSWLLIGIPITIPKIGDIVVFWRDKKTGWQGHVGLYAGHDMEKTHIITFGGNQNNMIGLYSYPVLTPTFGLLGFRELSYKK